MNDNQVSILGVDVGICNLAFVRCLCHYNPPRYPVDLSQPVPQPHMYTLIRIEAILKVDLTQIPHHRVSRTNCTLHHTRSACDQLDHMMQEYPDMFQHIHRIFIERQPLGGMQHIEQLLMSRWRDKACLVHPLTVHKYFQLTKESYDKRKQQVVDITLPYLSPMEDYHTLYKERQHDIGDALLMVLCSIHHPLSIVPRHDSTPSEFTDDQLQSFFGQFRYQRPVSGTTTDT